MHRFLTLIAGALLALGLTARLPAGTAERYEVTPLPFIPFSNTGGEALNISGVVAGGIVDSDGSVSLAQWSHGVLRSAEAAAINDRGEVLGFGETSTGKSQYFLLTPDAQGVLKPKPVTSSPPGGSP